MGFALTVRPYIFINFRIPGLLNCCLFRVFVLSRFRDKKVLFDSPINKNFRCTK